MPDFIQPESFVLGLLLSSAIGLAGWKGNSLSPSGVLGAILIGTAIFTFGGWAWGILLIAFFATSSLLSHYKLRQKTGLAEKFAKTGRRDLSQALANGGVAALIALIAAFSDNRLAFYVAFSGALAAVTADTWATELGVLSRRPPRMITSRRIAAVGTSGAVSLVGTLAAAGGALTIGIIASLLGSFDTSLLGGIDLLGLVLVAAVTLVSGLGGALADSLLGATVQAIYWCPRDQKETEKQIHTCGTRTTLRRGWPWLNNEWVNAACSLTGALLAWVLWMLVIG